MAVAQVTSFSLDAGNDIVQPFSVVDADGDALALVDWDAIFIISRNIYHDRLVYTVEDGDITVEAVNTLHIAIAADDTRAYSGEYDYELVVISPSGSEIAAVRGRLTFVATANREVAA